MNPDPRTDVPGPHRPAVVPPPTAARSLGPVVSTEPTEPTEPLCIDCDSCVMQHTDACTDCVVTFICSREPDEAVVIDVDEARALRLLGEAGLVPHLRHRRRTG